MDVYCINEDLDTLKKEIEDGNVKLEECRLFRQVGNVPSVIANYREACIKDPSLTKKAFIKNEENKKKTEKKTEKQAKKWVEIPKEYFFYFENEPAEDCDFRIVYPSGEINENPYTKINEDLDELNQLCVKIKLTNNAKAIYLTDEEKRQIYHYLNNFYMNDLCDPILKLSKALKSKGKSSRLDPSNIDEFLPENLHDDVKAIILSLVSENKKVGDILDKANSIYNDFRLTHITFYTRISSMLGVQEKPKEMINYKQFMTLSERSDLFGKNRSLVKRPVSNDELASIFEYAHINNIENVLSVKKRFPYMPSETVWHLTESEFNELIERSKILMSDEEYVDWYYKEHNPKEITFEELFKMGTIPLATKEEIVHLLLEIKYYTFDDMQNELRTTTAEYPHNYAYNIMVNYHTFKKWLTKYEKTIKFIHDFDLLSAEEKAFYDEAYRLDD